MGEASEAGGRTTERVPVSKRLVFVNSLGGFVSRVVYVVFQFWVYKHLLDRVSPEEFSLYPVVLSVMMFVPVFTVIFSSGVLRYLIAAYAKDDQERITRITSTTMAMMGMVVGILMLVASVFVFYIDRILTIEPAFTGTARLMMGILIYSFLLRLPFFPLAQGLFMRQRFIVQNAIEIAMQVLQISLLFIFLFMVSTSVLWLVVTTAIVDILHLLIRIGISVRIVPALRFKIKYITLSLLPELLYFGVWQTISQIARDIRESSDVLILNKLATELDVNAFYIGSLVHRQLRSLSVMVTTPLQPALIAIHESGGRERLKNAYLRLGKYGIWVVMVVVAPLIIFSRELILLYAGDQYLMAATVMTLLLLVYPVSYGHTILYRIAYAMAQVREWSIISLSTQIANLALTLYFVWVLKWGAVGSALATLIISIITIVFFAAPLAGRLMEFSFGEWIRETALPGYGPTLIGSVVWYGLKLTIHPTTWVTVIACMVAGAVAYAAGLAAFTLGPYECDALRSIDGKLPIVGRMLRLLRII